MISIERYEGKLQRESLRQLEYKEDVSNIVSSIIEDVRNRKDEAVLDYSFQFDKVKLESLLVSKTEMVEAELFSEPKFKEVLAKAIDNIEKFHSKQISSGFFHTDKDGIVLGQKIVPIEKVGIYVPGGMAVYPSSVLMNTIPAKIAGCKEIIMVTPPDKNGKIKPEILLAADMAGVDKIFKVGGAQAIAALAYGTETIPKVDKIVGPGNAFVAEAKRQVFGNVAIDMMAGPSEILIIADQYANPHFIAADLLAQAEHDLMAQAILITDSEVLAEAVQMEIEAQLLNLERELIARNAIDNNGKIIIADNIEQAIEISNEIAPEHLALYVKNSFNYLDDIIHAGSIFLGEYTPEVLRDYFSGVNHILPTMGTARFSSPLGVDDFVKRVQYSHYTKEALMHVVDDVAFFAKKEGLTAHANSIKIRKIYENIEGNQ